MNEINYTAEEYEELSRKRMHDGSLHIPYGDDLVRRQTAAQELLDEFNLLKASEKAKKTEYMQKMFASIGEGTYIEGPLNANWGGHHVHIGKNVYINSNCTFVDDSHIYIGDYTMIAPNVVLATAAHPMSPRLRRKGYQYNLPVHIGENVWLGAGVVVLPGVTIGDNTVIGAGSVVTKDIPANVIAFGNPAKVHREIGELDELQFNRGAKINHDEIDAEIRFYEK